jgi:hypothetical protein
MLEKARDSNGVGRDAVMSCISNWNLKGLPPNSDVWAAFFWSHQRGWFRQTVWGADFQDIQEKEGVGFNKLKVAGAIASTQKLNDRSILIDREMENRYIKNFLLTSR